VALEDRTARLTILVDPRKKAVFERLCADEDATPSQIVRRLIRRYIEERTGQPWVPSEGGAGSEAGSGTGHSAALTGSRSTSGERE
jgi:hypothetical protein